jgi:hypothetical protein
MLLERMNPIARKMSRDTPSDHSHTVSVRPTDRKKVGAVLAPSRKTLVRGVELKKKFKREDLQPN